LDARYAISDAERQFIEDNTRQDAARQQLGYFPDFADVPDQVRRHIIRQLDLPAETALGRRGSSVEGTALLSSPDQDISGERALHKRWTGSCSWLDLRCCPHDE